MKLTAKRLTKLEQSMRISLTPELSITKPLHFVDDGYTGTNFNRPAVTDMLDKVRRGIIKNIVVKENLEVSNLNLANE